ncbi:MAG: hypothetical protein KF758_13080 [Anaerolineales bacterium]|nr:hypothetical protein [Anaerolineales bacterium]MBX3037836.1 hypothetical protein [Anaerolineales bacterium]
MENKSDQTNFNINIDGKVESSVVIQGNNNTVINRPFTEYGDWTTKISGFFQSDIPRLNRLNFKNEDIPIVISNWSYLFLGSPAFWGYLIVTPYRFIVISFKKEVEEKDKIESGIYTSRFINPNFPPLSEEVLKTRHVTEIPLSYITSIQLIECPIDDERITQKRVFRLLLDTAEENDMAFGTRFFLYNREDTEKIQKTIQHYYPNVKFSFQSEPLK